MKNKGIISRIIAHFWGNCYKIVYTDIYGRPHTIRIIAKDPRETAFVAAVLHELHKDPEICSVRNVKT